MNRKNLKKKLTDILHKWIKQKYAIDDWVLCITCRKCYPLGSPFIHAGHFIPKSVSPGLRFHIDNIRPQCQYCNFDGGQPEKFEIALRDEIGNDRVDWLLANKHLQESKHPPEWYLAEIEKYKNFHSDNF